MKTIGRTNEGQYLVEMSEEEHKSFWLLAMAVEGKVEGDLIMQNPRGVATQDDFAGIFGAIRAFALSQFRINELRYWADRFQEVLHGKA